MLKSTQEAPLLPAMVCDRVCHSTHLADTLSLCSMELTRTADGAALKRSCTEDSGSHSCLMCQGGQVGLSERSFITSDIWTLGPQSVVLEELCH